jgi:hypothetical protein
MSALYPRQVAKAFGAVLRAAGVAAGISQQVLAERADCDRTYPSLLHLSLEALFSQAQWVASICS